MIKYILATTIFTIFMAHNVEAISLYTHSEAAPKNSIFFDVGIAAYELPDDFALYVPKLRFAADWMLPTSLPFSIGAYMLAPFPNLTDFGLRAAYHINFESETVDFYFLYYFNLGFLRNAELRSNGLDEIDLHWFDFRAGFRYVFNYNLGVMIETGYKLNSIMFGVTVRIF
ncbi:MAG: hypothetical protein Ta2B_05630 [Termitinemataceae bacterium]|nr:MAG: hypothetical protein Ta2B_05630 [Termitinemataceae bacterium]